jgi:hypothetical protein
VLALRIACELHWGEKNNGRSFLLIWPLWADRSRDALFLDEDPPSRPPRWVPCPCPLSSLFPHRVKRRKDDNAHIRSCGQLLQEGLGRSRRSGAH